MLEIEQSYIENANIPEYHITEQDYKDARQIAKTRAFHYIQCGWTQFQMDELLSAAYEGVCEAAVRFDPYKGNLKDTKFTSYAYFWIEKYIKEYIASNKSVVSGSLSDCWTGKVPYAMSIDAYDTGDTDQAGSDHKDWLGTCDSIEDAMSNSETTAEKLDMLSELLLKLEPLERLVIQLSVGIGTLNGQAMTVRQIAHAIEHKPIDTQNILDSAYAKLMSYKEDYAEAYAML